MRSRFSLLVCLLLTACGSAPSNPPPSLATLAVNIAGVPNDAAADVTVSGPAGFMKVLHSGSLLKALEAGDYTITAADVTWNRTAYHARVTPASVHLVDTPVSVDVAYEAGPTPPTPFTADSSDVDFTGGDVVLSWPPGNAASYSLGVTPQEGVTGLPTAPITGTSWRVHLPENTGNTSKTYIFTLTATAADGTMSPAGSVTVLQFISNTGTLRIEVTGLPAGAAPDATVSRYFDPPIAVKAAGTLTNVPAGTYTATANPVEAGGLTYLGSSDGSVVVAGTAPQVMTLRYHQVAVRLRGLPSTVGTGTVNVLTATVADPADPVFWRVTGGYFAGLSVPTTRGTTVTWIAPSTPGTVTLTGTSGLHPEESDTLTVTVTPEGLQEWVTRTGGPFSDDGTAVAVDAEGNTYMAGTRANADGYGKRELFLAKFDRTGQQVWLNAFGDPSGGTARAVAVTPGGTVYVTGESPYDTWDGTTGGPNSPYLATFTADGTMMRVQSLPAGRAFSQALALTADGDVLVAGTATGNVDGQHPEPTRGSAFLLKLGADGQLRWARQYALMRGSYEQGTGVAVDGLGNVYLLGTTTGPVDDANPNTQMRDDVFVAMYDAAGTQQWFKPFGVNATYSAQAWDIAGVPEGGAALVWNAGFNGRITQLRADGTRAWEMPLAVGGSDGYGQAKKVRVGTDGQVYVMGSSNMLEMTDNPGRNFVARYTAQGTWAWCRRFGGRDDITAHALALAPDGGLVVTGESWGGFGLPNLGQYDAFVLRIGR